jgi:hypothetical protein
VECRGHRRLAEGAAPWEVAAEKFDVGIIDPEESAVFEFGDDNISMQGCEKRIRLHGWGVRQELQAVKNRAKAGIPVKADMAGGAADKIFKRSFGKRRWRLKDVGNPVGLQ